MESPDNPDKGRSPKSNRALYGGAEPPPHIRRQAVAPTAYDFEAKQSFYEKYHDPRASPELTRKAW